MTVQYIYKFVPVFKLESWPTHLFHAQTSSSCTCTDSECRAEFIFRGLNLLRSNLWFLSRIWKCFSSAFRDWYRFLWWEFRREMRWRVCRFESYRMFLGLVCSLRSRVRAYIELSSPPCRCPSTPFSDVSFVRRTISFNLIWLNDALKNDSYPLSVLLNIFHRNAFGLGL